MIPISASPLPRYRALYWDGTYIEDVTTDRFDDLPSAEYLASTVSRRATETVVEVWDVLLMCPMAWYKAGRLGWHR